MPGPPVGLCSIPPAPPNEPELNPLDPPVPPSNDLSATAAGFAASADYRVSLSSVIGAASAIGETRWNVAGVGKGNADVAQVGGYTSTRLNDLYVSGAIALGWHDASTDRTLNIAGTDQLRADFNTTSWGAGLEGGYRYGGPAFSQAMSGTMLRWRASSRHSRLSEPATRRTEPEMRPERMCSIISSASTTQNAGTRRSAI